MDIQLTSLLRGRPLRLWQELMCRAGLEPDRDAEVFVLVWEGETLTASGSRKGNLLKCIAVDPDHRGEDLTAAVLTQLRTDALRAGHRQLFLYTKPENRQLFRNLFFYPVACTDRVLLMENSPNGIESFLSTLPPHSGGNSGALVMNCNPFTLGHRYLVERAASACEKVYVFVLSQEQPPFTGADRLEMVRRGTADLPNVTVLPTGPYLISSATFPTYFLRERDRAEEVHCMLDIRIFSDYFVPRFGITHRFVGEEPFSPMTARYNEALKTHLTACQVVEIPRLEACGTAISASAVREKMASGEDIRSLVPPSTYQYLIQGGYLNV